jgi:putative membrane protein
MRKLTMPFVAVVALFCLALAGCQQQKGASDREANREPSAQQTQQTQEAQSEQLNSDQRFIVDAAQDGRSEVELGQLAASKASSPAVKRLAQKIVADHTKANQQLESLPSASQALQSATMPPEKGSTTDRLSQLSGKEFDRAFVEQVVQDHENAINRFKEAAASAQDPTVKQFASQTLATLEQHLEMAKSLQKSLGGSSRGAGN